MRFASVYKDFQEITDFERATSGPSEQETDMPGDEASNPGGGHDPLRPGPEPGIKDMLEAGVGFVSSRIEHAFGHTTTEHRMAHRLHKVRWALENRSHVLTPAQRQALALVYGCVMPPNTAARRLGVTRAAFRQRLVRAETKVDEEYASEDRPRNRDKRGRPDARLEVIDGAIKLELEAMENLGPAGASFILDGSGIGHPALWPDVMRTGRLPHRLTMGEAYDEEEHWVIQERNCPLNSCGKAIIRGTTPAEMDAATLEHFRRAHDLDQRLAGQARGDTEATPPANYGRGATG